MSFTVALPCPHCGFTASYTVNNGGTGSCGAQCRNCHKTFRIYYHNGQFKEVRLH